MQRADAGVPGKTQVEEGRVREAGEDLRIAAHGSPVHLGRDAQEPVAAACHEDAAHVGIGQHAIEIGGARLIAPREMPAPVEEVARESHAKSSPLEKARACRHGPSLNGAGWSHDPDRVAGTEPGRSDHRGIVPGRRTGSGSGR
jgi:hypothetical protein